MPVSDEEAAKMKEEQRQIQEEELIEIGCANADKDRQIQALLDDREERIQEHKRDKEAVIAKIERLRDSDEADFSASEDGFSAGHNQGFIKACRMILAFIRNPEGG